VIGNVEVLLFFEYVVLLFIYKLNKTDMIMSRTTNKEQYKKIVDLLGDNVDIAQGYSKKGKHEM